MDGLFGGSCVRTLEVELRHSGQHAGWFNERCLVPLDYRLLTALSAFAATGFEPVHLSRGSDGI